MLIPDLMLSGPLQVRLEPTRQEVKPGDDANIMCSATGEGPIEISWNAVGRNLPRSATAHDGYLLFRRISIADQGKYVCMATSPYGTAEATAEVLVVGE